MVDLHAADAIYLRLCSANFRIGKKKLLQYLSNVEANQKLGRPENTTQYHAFIDACSCFDANNDDQFTLTEFTNKMNEFLRNTEYEAYDPRHIKQNS